MLAEQALQVLEESDQLVSAEAVHSALDRLGLEITHALGQCNPLLLVVMRGGLYFAGQLLPRLQFPLDLDYIHATRYGDATSGGQLQWKVEPPAQVSGRHVLVLDDILDGGDTLAEIRQRLLALGAATVRSAVLTDKQHGRPKPIAADFVGLALPDRYVFGCGMDVSGAWRNLSAIHAMKDS
jgi:hypoxanthine phosphoribosyltransferase